MYKRQAYGREIDPNRVTDVQELGGHGVTAKVDGRTVAAGNARLMEKLGDVYKRQVVDWICSTEPFFTRLPILYAALGVEICIMRENSAMVGSPIAMMPSMQKLSLIHI